MTQFALWKKRSCSSVACEQGDQLEGCENDPGESPCGRDSGSDHGVRPSGWAEIVGELRDPAGEGLAAVSGVLPRWHLRGRRGRSATGRSERRAGGAPGWWPGQEFTMPLLSISQQPALIHFSTSWAPITCREGSRTEGNTNQPASALRADVAEAEGHPQ